MRYLLAFVLLCLVACGERALSRPIGGDGVGSATGPGGAGGSAGSVSASEATSSASSGMDCPTGTKLCAGACQSTSDPLWGCQGSCDPCVFDNAAPVCVAGECSMGACSSGWYDCNATSDDGCEINVAMSPTDCGACGNACSVNHANPSCSAGSCIETCDAGWSDCNGFDADGCETDLSSATTCGDCFTTCPVGLACMNGDCQTCGALPDLSGGMTYGKYYVTAFPYTPLHPETMTAIEIHGVSSTACNFKYVSVYLFASGGSSPGSLLASASSLLDPAKPWDRATFTLPIPLLSGLTYWIGVSALDNCVYTGGSAVPMVPYRQSTSYNGPWSTGALAGYPNGMAPMLARVIADCD